MTTNGAANGTVDAAAAVRASLAPGGALRAGINYNNPLLSRRDPKTGELSGLAVDLSRQLAQNIGAGVELIPYDTAGNLAQGAAKGAWDIAYLAIDPARATDIEFSPPYLLLEGTYLVRATSPLRTMEDFDRDGVRIAVTARSAYDLHLSRTLQHAQLVRFETTPLSIDRMVEQNLDAVAAVRTALVAAAARVPDARILPGHFMTIPQAAGVPKGRAMAARYVRQFIEQAKASGLVAQLLERHNLGPNDAIVAPASSA